MARAPSRRTGGGDKNSRRRLVVFIEQVALVKPQTWRSCIARREILSSSKLSHARVKPPILGRKEKLNQKVSAANRRNLCALSSPTIRHFRQLEAIKWKILAGPSLGGLPIILSPQQPTYEHAWREDGRDDGPTQRLLSERLNSPSVIIQIIIALGVLAGRHLVAWRFPIYLYGIIFNQW